MTSGRHEAVQQIQATGYCVVRLDARAAAALATLLGRAEHFFAEPLETKERHAGKNRNYGFRRFGIEYSQVSERPDYNECFTYWASRWDLVPGHDRIEPFLTALEAWTRVCADLTQELLRGLADCYMSNPPPFEDASHLQVNSALPAPAERQFLQDLHEDGHLLTVLHATDVGLEIPDMGPVFLAPSEILVFSGSILTLLTEGDIPPTFHQVRNHGLTQRLSVMYFVNPELTDPIHPWSAGSTTVNTEDLRAAVRRNPLAFGLPEVEEL